MRDPRIKKGVFVRTSYGIGEAETPLMLGGEMMVPIRWEEQNSYSTWPETAVEYFAASEQEMAELVLGEDYFG